MKRKFQIPAEELKLAGDSDRFGGQRFKTDEAADAMMRVQLTVSEVGAALAERLEALIDAVGKLSLSLCSAIGASSRR